MRARLGADDLDFFLEPDRDLLRAVSGIEPAATDLHVLLDGHGVRSTQRLALSRYRGGVVAALWPAELKEQAEYLYGRQLATRMVAAAGECGWYTAGSPHLAFRNSAAPQRLYMKPECDAGEYARRWQQGDLRRVGQHSRAEVEHGLWPWLKQRGYADDEDDRALQHFLAQLGKRPAFLRPGLRLRGEWSEAAVKRAGGDHTLATVIRKDVNAILAAAAEPRLPTRS